RTGRLPDSRPRRFRQEKRYVAFKDRATSVLHERPINAGQYQDFIATILGTNATSIALALQ
ncbi:hypothetical protein, partial [Streptomyces sp. NPDC015130]|uniref:hypothetical protein n=1 Tax=Streptomyces sp. NPDC015130 TaxID=3364940 RepID=UPI003700B0E5